MEDTSLDITMKWVLKYLVYCLVWWWWAKRDLPSFSLYKTFYSILLLLWWGLDLQSISSKVGFVYCGAGVCLDYCCVFDAAGCCGAVVFVADAAFPCVCSPAAMP